MESSLGSIFVELTCNTAKFLSGMDKASVAAKKTGKDIRAGLGEVGGSLALLGDTGARLGSILEGVGDKAKDAFDVAGNKGRGFGALMAGSVLAGVTGLAGGMFALAAHAAEVGSKIFEASEKTGISASQMSGLMAITKETGGNFDALTTSLARAGANLEKGIIAPGAGAGKILAQVMGSAKNLSDLGLKPMGDRLQIVLAHIFAMNDTGQRNVALSTLLGRGWMENVSTLKLLAEQGYAPAIEAAKRHHAFFDDNAARQAKQFNVEMAALTSEVSGLGLALGENLIPYLNEFLINMASAKPDLEAFALRVRAIELALTGVGIPFAVKLWKEAGEKIKEANEQSNQFAINAAKMTEGAKVAADATGKLTGAVKQHSDVLASIIEREQDELTSLGTLGNKQREAQAEYDRTTREIQKQITAGGSYAESVKAMGLAWDIYRTKYMAAMQESVKVPHGPGVPQSPGAPPALALPSSGQLFGSLAIGGTMPPMNKTLSELANYQDRLDSTRGAEKALHEELELSDAAFAKLAQAFPKLANAESAYAMKTIAATAAGRNMIAQLTEFDKLGTASEQFTEFKNHLINDGNDIAGHLIQTLGGALSQLEDDFAKLATGGRVNFRQISKGIEESLIKTGEQKAVSSVLSTVMHGKFGGDKADGSSADKALWVKMADALHKPGASAAPGLGSGASGVASLPSDVSSMFQTLSKGLGSLGGFFGKIFGGFLAEGGDVMPGKAYVVGERRPELFMPRAAGRVVPQVGAQQLKPLYYSATYNINTPNADSFRRTQSQIMADGYRQAALAHARNS